MSVFFCICEYLGVTPAEFFETEIKSPEEIRRITENLAYLDDESLNSIAQIVKKLSSK